MKGKRSSAALDDYDIITQCGSGTYGSVFRAVHKNTRQVVAVKKVTKFPMEDGFPVECKYLEQLCSSKNVINMLEYFYSQDGQLVLVFEYMETDLWKLISGPNANVPLLQIKCIMKQLFEALYQCHNAGIMHRDVKPSNLLINSDGVLKLADFGLTTSFVKPPYLSNNVVSLYYRPPELLLGSHSYGPEIDMWSAGCILVELLTNNYLFAGANDADQLDMIFKVFGTPDEDVWPGVTKLPGWAAVEAKKMHPLRDLHDNYKFMDPSVLDLASQLLQLDPKKRISSYEALNHPWFISNPLPCAPSFLPNLWKNNPKFKSKSTHVPVKQQQHNNYQENQMWRKDDSYYPPVNFDNGYYFQPNYQYNNNFNFNYYPNNGYGNNVNYYYYNNPNNGYNPFNGMSFPNPYFNGGNYYMSQNQYNYAQYAPNYNYEYYYPNGYGNYDGNWRAPPVREGYSQSIWPTATLNSVDVN